MWNNILKQGHICSKCSFKAKKDLIRASIGLNKGKKNKRRKKFKKKWGFGYNVISGQNSLSKYKRLQKQETESNRRRNNK